MTQQQNILKYIPQRPPFVFVDTIVSVTDTQTVTTFDIKEGNLFCEEGIFYEAGMIENIAQTVAAGSGYRLNKKNEEPKIGLIGAVKNLKVFCRPRAGCSIRTVTELITNFENAMVVQGTIFNEEKPIASCQMNIFIIDHPNL